MLKTKTKIEVFIMKKKLIQINVVRHCQETWNVVTVLEGNTTYLRNAPCRKAHFACLVCKRTWL